MSEREERKTYPFLLSEDENEETAQGRVRERLREARWGAWGSKHVKSGHPSANVLHGGGVEGSNPRIQTA